MSQVNSRSVVNTRSEVLKGLAAGAIGGLVASWVMDEFQSAWFKLSSLSRRAQPVSLRRQTMETITRGEAEPLR